jgi:hypothetical protein
MKANQKHENYGVYITQNTYTMKWHAFRNEDATKYWNGEKGFKEGIGETPQKALMNFKK